MAGKPAKRDAKRPADPGRFQNAFIASIAPDSHFHLALNCLGNTRVLVKDQAGRFIWVSDNVPRRHGFTTAAEMVGLDDWDINPPKLAKIYREDDLGVMRSGEPLLGRVELAFDERGMLRWYVTNKLPLRDRLGKVIGLIATIQEHAGVPEMPTFGSELQEVVQYILAHLTESLPLTHLAALAGVSARQLERRFRNAMGTSPTDFILRARLDEACRRLRESDDTIGRIALDLQFYDQSAFTRLFRRHLGMTPKAFRQTRAGRGTGER